MHDLQEQIDAFVRRGGWRIFCAAPARARLASRGHIPCPATIVGVSDRACDALASHCPTGRSSESAGRGAQAPPSRVSLASARRIAAYFAAYIRDSSNSVQAAAHSFWCMKDDSRS